MHGEYTFFIFRVRQVGPGHADSPNADPSCSREEHCFCFTAEKVHPGENKEGVDFMANLLVGNYSLEVAYHV